MFQSKTCTTALAVLMATASFFQPGLADPAPAGLEGLTKFTSFSDRRGIYERQTLVNGGCAEGEVAVGTWQTCSPAPGGICNPGGCGGTDGGCQAELGGVWEVNCGGNRIASTSMTSGFCSGGWHGSLHDTELGVRCGDGDVVEAVTSSQGGTTIDGWNNCYKPESGFCQTTNGLASQYSSIQWCCKLVGGDCPFGLCLGR
ncbi:hypothetical protein DL765_004667 [Monosporascus sp. GIB2]|nr:hypothetical protein DL765_004667 [Monosporascus sp. GIB2]